MDRSAPQLNRDWKSGATAKWQRLAEMGTHEIAYRLYKELAFRFDKWRTRQGVKEVSDEELIRDFGIDWLTMQPELSLQMLRRYLRETVAPRFYFNPARRAEYLELVKREYPQWIERARVQADLVCQHRFNLLGLDEISLGEQIDWHRDPETARSWPQKHWIDIPLNGSEAAGDPKVIWELNRHQQLVWLGLAYFYTDDESYVNEYIYQIESWIEQNPYQLGINWASSLEIGFRAINWLWALCFFINSPRLHNENILRIVKSLTRHFEAIMHNPSIYSSPNTHLIGEACALYLGGVLFAEHSQAGKWRKFAALVLEDEVKKQIGSDGGHKEQSAYYHAYTTEFYLLTAVLMRRNNIALSEPLWNGLKHACEFLMHICAPNRELTAFGDEDGGKLLMIGSRTYRQPADILAAAAVLFERGDFKYCAGEFQEAALWLMGPAAFDRFKRLKATPASSTSICLADAGQIALRNDWSEQSNYLLFHCTRKTALPGHTHADSLSIEMASNGQLRLIDSGTYRYNSGELVRNHFRGTAAHNTVRIDGIDQSITGGAFKWQRQADTQILQTCFSNTADYVSAEHNGYLALASPCLHRRAVLFAKPDYFLIWDEFRGSGEHDYESFFHFGDAEITQTAEGWLRISYPDGEKLLLVPLMASAISVESSKGGSALQEGWRSRAYGEKAPSLSLRLHYRGAAPLATLTMLFPYRQAPPEIKICAINELNQFTVQIKSASGEDIVASSLSCRTIEQDGLRFNGEKLWLRTVAGRATSALAVGSNLIQYRDQQIQNDSQMQPDLIWDSSRALSSER